MEFRGQGRLGCPHDYEAFRLGLDPILKRVHRSLQHAGKRPPHYLANREALEEMVDMRRQLLEAIDREDYEQAARVRDMIRQKEAAG
jgi:protein arginine kinase activator